MLLLLGINWLTNAPNSKGLSIKLMLTIFVPDIGFDTGANPENAVLILLKENSLNTES